MTIDYIKQRDVSINPNSFAGNTYSGDKNYSSFLILVVKLTGKLCPNDS
jgi:hypothetical protein